MLAHHDGLPVGEDHATGGSNKIKNQAEKSSFARSVISHKTKALTFGDMEFGNAERADTSVIFCEILCFYHIVILVG